MVVFFSHCAYIILIDRTFSNSWMNSLLQLCVHFLNATYWIPSCSANSPVLLFMTVESSTYYSYLVHFPAQAHFCDIVLFVIYFYGFVNYGTPSCPKGHHFYFIFCDIQDTMPRQSSLLSSVTFPNQHVPRGAQNFLRGDNYFNCVCASAHIANLLSTKKY